MCPGDAWPFRNDVLTDGGTEAPPKAPEEGAFLHPFHSPGEEIQGYLFLIVAFDIRGTTAARRESCARDGEAGG